MSQIDLSKMSLDGLVERYVEILLQMDQANLFSQIAKYNRLFKQKTQIVEELKRRDGDQRRLLIPLLNHQNIFVRLHAAIATLALAPVEARSQIQAIADARLDIYSGDAGMLLRGLDDGTFKPT